MRSLIAAAVKAAPSPEVAVSRSESAAPRMERARSRGRWSWLKCFDSDVLEDVMGWSWVIGLGLTAFGIVIIGGLALAIGSGAVNISDCAWAVFAAAGVGMTGLLIFAVAVLIVLLK